jgi:signal transduction histidine kinase
VTKPMDRIALRVVFVLIGAALALALALLDTTVIALLVDDGTLPVWAIVVLGSALVVGPPVILGLTPAMRTIEAVAATSLLQAELPGSTEPARTAGQRRRTLVWFVLHVLAGAVVVAGVTASLVAADAWLTALALVGCVAAAALLGSGLARLAPGLLGPSHAERLARLQADVERAVERNRLAREIHDGVGHALSLITVQAGAGRTVIDRDPAFAASALTAIEETARNAAADLDHVLGLLREESEPRPAPAADLGALEALVRATRSAGLRVEHRVSGDLSTVPGVVSREGYRVVQESLTNALRHSADGTARLWIGVDDGVLRIEVTNPGAPHRPASPASAQRTGRGLPGLIERVRALGGTIEAGPTDDGWRVSAQIPVGTGRSADSDATRGGRS